MSPVLEVKNLHVSVGDKEILKGIDLTINAGETHVLMGPNGAGKSTLGHSIMNDPKYKISEGDLFFEGENISNEDTDKRAKRGIFLTFQDPVPVPGISLGSFVRSSLEQEGENHINLWGVIKKARKYVIC